MFLSPMQLQELASIIEVQHISFAAKVCGKDYLTPYDELILEKNGIDLKSIPEIGSLETSYRFGILSEALGHAKAKEMKYTDFKKFLQSGNYLPLTSPEKEALQNVKTRAYTDISGLGNRIKGDVANSAIAIDKKQAAKYRGIIKKEAVESIKNRVTVGEFARSLGHKTGDWARDFGRIADFVLHQAYDEGRAMSILEKYGDEALVYKQVLEGACDHCISAYMTNGLNSKPIVFKVSELIANGDNIGRKTKSWLPVVGPMHPFCRCTIFGVPKGLKWDEKTKDFTAPVSQRFSKNKIRIMVGDKEIL